MAQKRAMRSAVLTASAGCACASKAECRDRHRQRTAHNRCVSTLIPAMQPALNSQMFRSLHGLGVVANHGSRHAIVPGSNQNETLTWKHRIPCRKSRSCRIVHLDKQFIHRTVDREELVPSIHPTSCKSRREIPEAELQRRRWSLVSDQ